MTRDYAQLTNKENRFPSDGGLDALTSPDLEPLYRTIQRFDHHSAWFGHVSFAQWLIRVLRPSFLVELGTHAGISYAALCQAVMAEGLTTACYAVDTWKGDEQAGYYDKQVYAELAAHNAQHFSGFSHLLRCSFDDARDMFVDGSVDLLHIDGLHTYEAVRHDFENWLPKMSDHGVVLLHDTAERAAGFEVWRFFSELKARWPTFEFVHGHGLGVVCTGTNVPEPLRMLCRLDRQRADVVRQRFSFLGNLWEAQATAAALHPAATKAQGEHVKSLDDEGVAADARLVASGEEEANRATVEARLTALEEAHRATIEASVAAAPDADSAQQPTRESRRTDLDPRADHFHDGAGQRGVARLTNIFSRLAGALSPAAQRSGGRKAHDGFFDNYRGIESHGAMAVDADPNYAKWINEIESSERPTRPKVNCQASVESPTFTFLLLNLNRRADWEATLHSLRKQTYPHWELIAGIPESDIPAMTISKAARVDPRVTFIDSSDVTDRGAAVAMLLKRATGAYCCVVDAGDVLAQNALEDIAYALAREPGVAIIYGDEDQLSPAGTRTAPYFKPSWSPELLHAFNYFGRLALISRALAIKHIESAIGTGAAAEWALNLRVADDATAGGLTIKRITRVLCHRSFVSECDRFGPWSPASAENRTMLHEYWRSRGMTDPHVETQLDGTQRSTWTIDNPPLVSVIIPSHNAPHLIRQIIRGLLDKTSYQNFELIIVDNRSSDPLTLAFYESLVHDRRIRIVRYDVPFNYSAACNRGAAVARGDLLLFLNNDIEVIDSHWLSEMVRAATLDGVGIVGIKLRYPTGELQHAGVAVGIHLYGLMYHGADESDWGVMGSPNHTRNWLAIMGACQMVRRDVFEHVGGFDESYKMANSDIALCLRAYRAGWRTVYTPHAELIHHEGKTRGKVNPPEDMARSALELERLGITEDPYLHPEISALHTAPRLRMGGEPNLRDKLQADCASVVGSIASAMGSLDIFNDMDVEAASGLAREFVICPPTNAADIRDQWSAARWVVNLLRRRPDLRAKFPRALSDHDQGDFAIWLEGSGGSRLGLSDQAKACLRAVFAADLSSRVVQLYFDRNDLRSEFPIGLLPAGRRGLAGWLLRHGSTELSFRLEEIWWFILTCAEDPGAELVRTYNFTPAWQEAHPAGLTIFGREALAVWVAERYLVREASWLDARLWPTHLSATEQIRLAYTAQDRWREFHPNAFDSESNASALLAWLASPDSHLTDEVRTWCRDRQSDGTAARLAGAGVNVIGHFCYPSGLRVSVKTMSDAMAEVGIAVSRRDIRTGPTDDPHHASFGGLEPFDVTIIHVQPEPYFDDCHSRSDLAERKPRPYRIAYWYWEFDAVPPDWARTAKNVDEVWAATGFVADALRQTVSVPVKTLFPGVQIGAFTARTWDQFGLQLERLNGRFVFLFSFHMASVMERKNPLGLIAAFREAFDPSEPVELLIKTKSSAAYEAQLAAMLRAAEGANITILDSVMTPDEILSLMNACSCYVSLHRSEGLGLAMAEAMLLGKPVIATRYSGNLDFMDDNNSLLVDCDIVELTTTIPPYEKGGCWAEPSITHAAQLMRKLYEDPALVTRLGQRAQADAQERLSLKKAGDRMAARLLEIKARSPMRADGSGQWTLESV